MEIIYFMGESPHSYYAYNQNGILLLTWSCNKDYDIESFMCPNFDLEDSKWRGALYPIAGGVATLKGAKSLLKSIAEKELAETPLYENPWCKIVSKDMGYALMSKSDKYNDQYFLTLPLALKAIGILNYCFDANGRVVVKNAF